jgi:hypothetical protein
MAETMTRRQPICHPDRDHHARDLCHPCWNVVMRAINGSTPLPRTSCPGCGRDDVVLLAPTTRSSWRRKQHAVRGNLGQAGAMRCRYPAALTPDEITFA